MLPRIGPFRSYWLMIIIGIVLCFVMCAVLCDKLKINKKFKRFFLIATVFVIIFGFGSASLFQSLYEYIENPTRGFVISGNITFFGGLIGGTLTFILFYFWIGRKYETKFIDILSIIAVMITIAHAFGRIGCFCAGCCYGKETSSALGVQFPFLDHKVFPTQLFESAFLFILFAVLLFLILKYKFKYGLQLYAICYGVFRFLIEYMRGDPRGSFIPGISPSQFWGLVLIVVGIVTWILMHKVLQKNNNKIQEKQNID